MEENEGKDLAQDMKNEQIQEEYYQNVKLELDKIRLDNVTIAKKIETREDENGKNIEIEKYDVLIDFKGKSTCIATIDEMGNLTPNEELLKDEQYTDEDKRKLGDMLNLLGLQKDEIDMDKLQEQLKTIEAKTKEEIEQEKRLEEDEVVDSQEEKENPEELGDEEQAKTEDVNKEEVAEKLNVSKKHIVHVKKDEEKLTEDKTYEQLDAKVKGYEDVYVIQDGTKEYEHKVLGRKPGEKKLQEIEGTDKKMYGNYPTDVTIKRVDGEKIVEITPLAIYDIDGKSARAIVKNEWGELEQLYCRKERNEAKVFWGTVIPEHSDKNYRQEDFETREFMSSKNTSSIDLEKKAIELEKAQDLNDRGVPSEEEGVQVYEINGSPKQNYQTMKDEVAKDLMKRDGIVDKLTVPPGYYENKADKVLMMLYKNEKMQYEEAVKIIERQDQREEGGRTPGERRTR